MKSNKFKVLSLDGGGLRGIFSCHVLDRLGNYLGDSIHSKFDMVIGTSTGSLIGGMIASGLPASTILDLYKSLPNQVFNRSPNLLDKCLSKVGLRPSYDISILEKVIRERVGSHSLKQLLVDYMAIAYDVKQDKPLFFKSWDIDMENLSLCDVVCMSSACPTLFSGREFIHKGVQRIVVDGGLGVCNPIMIGIIQGLRQGYELKDIYVVSIGTGEEPYNITLDDVTKWGSLQWASKMTGILFSANDEVQTSIAREILGNNNVFRFQVNLKNNPMGVICPGVLASTKPEVIAKYVELGCKYVLLDDVNQMMSTIKDIWNKD